MKTLTPGLQSHLDSGATTLAWCWRIVRRDGTAYGFTDHDRDISFDGTIYEAASGFTGTDIRQSVGLSIDNLDVTGALSSERLNEADLAAGQFDDASVEIWRVNWVETAQRVLMMTGSIGEVRRGETAFTAELRSLSHYLDQKKGRTFQYACDATLGDARCTVDLENPVYKGHGTVATVSGPHLFTASGLNGFTDKWFDGGLLVWSTGQNAGREMELKRFTFGNGNALVELWRSMASGIAPGDLFTVTAGCDKTFPTCKAKFFNGANFRGFPHIPGNKYVLAYPVSGDPENDSASMNG